MALAAERRSKVESSSEPGAIAAAGASIECLPEAMLASLVAGSEADGVVSANGYIAKLGVTLWTIEARSWLQKYLGINYHRAGRVAILNRILKELRSHRTAIAKRFIRAGA
jgi:hypothetical protein